MEVPLNLPPVFETDLKSQTITAGTSSEWKLPKLKDPEGEAVSLINVKLGTTSTWMEFDPVSMEFKFNGSKTVKVGFYMIQIVAKDSLGATLNEIQPVNVQADPTMVKASTDKAIGNSNGSTSTG